MKQTLKRIGFGFVLGMAVGNLIAALTGHPDIVSPALLAKAGSLPAALLYQTMLSGLIGAAGFGGMGFYEVERWPLLLAVAAHFGLILAVFLPVARFLGWCGTAAELLAVAACMGAAHLAIFLVMCAYYRKQVRELNELQKRYRGKKRK